MSVAIVLAHGVARVFIALTRLLVSHPSNTFNSNFNSSLPALPSSRADARLTHV